MPRTILIENESLAFPLAQKVICEFPDLQLDEGLSKTVKSAADFERLEQFLSTTREPLLLILDLGLDMTLEYQANLRKKYQALGNEVGIPENWLDGVYLGYVAIANDNRAELLIVIATQQKIGASLFKVWSAAERQSKSQIRPFFTTSVGMNPFAIMTSEDEREQNARAILKEAQRLWNERFGGTAGERGGIEKIARDWWELYRKDATHPNPGAPIQSRLLPEIWGDPENIESFKALYNNDYTTSDIEAFADQSDSLARRYCYVAVLQAILEFLGISLKVQGLHAEDVVLLPVQPGMLFVLNLAKFLQHMGIRSATLDMKASTLELSVRLQEPLKFESAISTRTGRQGSDLFYQLLACRSEVVSSFLESADKDRVRKEWPPQPFREITGKTPHVYRCLVRWRVDLPSSLLCLWWESYVSK